MHRWQREISIALSLMAAALVLAYFIGHLSTLLLFITIFLYIRQSLAISELEKWLSRGAFGDMRHKKGIWADIYYHLWKLKKTEKKRKKKLSRMVEQFRTSTDALPDAAVVMGSYAEIEWSNRACRTVLGLKKSDKGQRVPNLIRNPAFVQYLKSNDYSQKITIPSPVNENQILQISITPYGEGLRLLLAQDVTTLKNIERMRTDFVANVSHELRTPLTVLKGYLETLVEIDGGETFYSKSFQNMAEQTERMTVLIDDLLLLSRLETKHRHTECVDAPHLIEQLCQDSRLPIKDIGRIELSLDSDARLLGDETELHSAFSNLVSNALKYSSTDKPIKVRWQNDAEVGVFLEVEDFGEGISSSEIPKITERFYRADVKRNQKISGTGLGLAIVKHVMARHEGKLEVHSQLGKGSRFRCWFPNNRVC
jgi:two-component system phosphate regulon sensor histidine kinase PhoR